MAEVSSVQTAPSQYGFGGSMSAVFPSQVIIDVTELCNLACIHCPHPQFKQSEHYAGRTLDPACDEAWTWEGIALRRQGAVADARSALSKALEVNPHSSHARRELIALDEDF